MQIQTRNHRHRQAMHTLGSIFEDAFNQCTKYVNPPSKQHGTQNELIYKTTTRNKYYDLVPSLCSINISQRNSTSRCIKKTGQIRANKTRLKKLHPNQYTSPLNSLRNKYSMYASLPQRKHKQANKQIQQQSKITSYKK